MPHSHVLLALLSTALGAPSGSPSSAGAYKPLPEVRISPEEAVYACDYSASGTPGFTGTCTEYTGKLWMTSSALHELELQCMEIGGAWVDDGCPHEGFEGACLLNEGLTTETETFYYDDYAPPFAPDPIDAARSACESVGGVWG